MLKGDCTFQKHDIFFLLKHDTPKMSSHWFGEFNSAMNQISKSFSLCCWNNYRICGMLLVSLRNIKYILLTAAKIWNVILVFIWQNNNAKTSHCQNPKIKLMDILTKLKCFHWFCVSSEYNRTAPFCNKFDFCFKVCKWMFCFLFLFYCFADYYYQNYFSWTDFLCFLFCFLDDPIKIWQPTICLWESLKQYMSEKAIANISFSNWPNEMCIIYMMYF